MNGAGALGESGDAGQDVIGRFRPATYGLTGGVRSVDERANRGFERPDTAVHAATELLGLERGEPAFHEVEPRRIGRREMRMEAGMSSEPPSDVCFFVCVLFVYDDVYV